MNSRPATGAVLVSDCECLKEAQDSSNEAQSGLSRAIYPEIVSSSVPFVQKTSRCYRGTTKKGRGEVGVDFAHLKSSEGILPWLLQEVLDL